MALTLSSTPSNRTRSDGFPMDVRSIGTAAATPGTPATEACTASGKPVSVTPETSRLALPPIPATRRSDEPVMDPAMPNTATSNVAEIPTTTRDIEVRPG
jgi:hypothetical protein